MFGNRVLLDTGVLVAALNKTDRRHAEAAQAIESFQGVLLTTEAVLTESMYLIQRATPRPSACLEFFIRGGALLVPLSRSALRQGRAIMERYADLPADFADATLVALADDLGVFTILTLDRRGFSVYRGARGESFEIIP